jgi:hypothetical protein
MYPCAKLTQMKRYVLKVPDDPRAGKGWNLLWYRG